MFQPQIKRCMLIYAKNYMPLLVVFLKVYDDNQNVALYPHQTVTGLDLRITKKNKRCESNTSPCLICSMKESQRM